MKWWIGTGIVIGIGILLLVAGGAARGGDGVVRQTVEDAFQTAAIGLNTHNISTVDSLFATVAEGANADGLQQTREALYTFAGSLSGSDQVQFHDLAIKAVEVHDSAGLAKVTYQVHLSVVRNGSQLAFGATITQDLALLRTPRGWRISGGDQAQLSEIRGQWVAR